MKASGERTKATGHRTQRGHIVHHDAPATNTTDTEDLLMAMQAAYLGDTGNYASVHEVPFRQVSRGQA